MTMTATAAKACALLDSTRATWLALAFIVALAAFLRFYHLDQLSFTHDEAYSFWASRMSWHDLWTFLPRFDKHPPLFYSLLKLWSVFGDSEFAMRSMTALFSVLTVPCVYVLGRLAAAPARAGWMGLAAALLAAVTPVQIVHAQDARHYAGLSFSIALMLCGAAWLMRNSARAAVPLLGRGTRPGAARRAWFAFVVGAVLTLWHHNTGVFVVLVIGVAAFAWLVASFGWTRGVVGNVLGAGCAIVLLWAPLLPTLLTQTADLDEGFWIKDPTFATFESIVRNLLAVPVPYRHLAPVILAVALALGLWRTSRGEGRSVGWLLGATIVVPIALEVAVSYLMQPIIIPRTVIWLTVPLCVVLAAATTFVDRLPWRAFALAAVAALFVAASHNYHVNGKKEPWREYVGLILERAAPTDLVVVGSGHGDKAFFYYFGLDRDVPRVTIVPAVPDTFGLRTAGVIDHARARADRDATRPIEIDLERLRRDVAQASAVWHLGWFESKRISPLVHDEIAKVRRVEQVWEGPQLTMTLFR